MKIRYTTTGVEKDVKNEIGYALIDAGVAVAVDKTPAGLVPLPKPGDYKRQAPKWEVVEYAGIGRNYLAIKMQILGNVNLYTGDPSEIRLIGGHEPPLEIVREYIRAYEANPQLRDPGAVIPDGGSRKDNNKAAAEKAEADRNMKGGFAGVGAFKA
jgi:hypothetical protein